MRTDPLAYLGEELDALKQQNLYRRFRILEDGQKAHTTFDRRSVVNLSSNNYLGLTTHPRLRAKALEAVQHYGVGTGSVRTIAGTMDLHMELERKLAEFQTYYNAARSHASLDGRTPLTFTDNRQVAPWRSKPDTVGLLLPRPRPASIRRLTATHSRPTGKSTARRASARLASSRDSESAKRRSASFC